ncbi:ROK family protein [Intestinibacter sp.]|uniref:ROK family protein n=1 Tax=Intestinibacter sp. TaxID=1965304 RepID=UPI002A9135A3|nr:ROK family protein [Intestinibacter sp.]MDY5213003.1 ROK family protein [Intestinibacter sp.]
MYRIGVDVGGTGIKVGIVNELGDILYRGTCVTDVEGGFDKIISDIKTVIENIIEENHIKQEKIKSIGFGIPGYIDRHGKANCVNLNWKKVDFIQKLKENFPQFDIFADNDATVAGLAESKFGSTKEHDTSVVLTLGTGVGGAIIINGRPFSGVHGVGSEIGHMMIGDGDYKCNCGNTGCFETFCSATAIIKYTQKLLEEGNQSSILDMCDGDISNINAKMVFDAYNQNDEVAILVITRFKSYLARGIANIVNTIDPGVIAIGGGVSKSEDIILDGLKEMVRNHLVYKEEEFADIVIATLGNDAGIIGAAILGQ